MPIVPKIMRADELPAEIYHALPALSFSQLKILLDDHAPVDWWYRSWLNPKRPGDDEETTKALLFGRAMHMLVLEPEVFRTTYQQEPKHKSTSKPYFIGAAPGGDWEVMHRIRDNLLGVGLAEQILKGCKPEVSMHCHMEMPDPQAPKEKWRGHPVRCRFDIYKDTYACDLKFVEDVSDSAISNMFARYHYHNQAEWYLRIMKLCTGNDHQNFAFIFCEKSPPYKVRVVQVKEGPLAFARDRNDMAFATFLDYMHKYAALTAKGLEWPGYGNHIWDLVMEGEGGPRSISLPGWLK